MPVAKRKEHRFHLRATERDVSTIEHGQGKEIKQREVDVDQHGEPEREPPAILAAEHAEEDIHDAHRPAEL